MESTLALKLSQLESAVGDFLGYGRGEDQDETAWTAKQQNDITDNVNTGLHFFYRPSPVEGIAPNGHQWSFMRPYRELTLAEGATEITLPDDFGGLDGRLVVSLDSNSYTPLAVWNINRLKAMQAAEPDTTGSPEYAALEWVKGTSLKAGQRARLVFHPEADDDYTIGLTYFVLGEALTSANPYPLGGAAHAETIKAACIAAAEIYKDDQKGVRWMHFQERLAASILEDRKHKPPNHGYNADRSDLMETGGRRWHGGAVTVTYEGTEY